MNQTSNENPILTCDQATLGNEFGSLFNHALAEWVDLSLTWSQYEKLFGHGQERIDLLNQSGASFFERIQRHFFESVIMALCRLSDKPKSFSRSNLTVFRFEKFMTTADHKSNMKKILASVDESMKFPRDWRNRHIAHNDYELKVKKSTKLEPATRNGVTTAIQSLFSVFSYVSEEFQNTTLSDEVIDTLDDGEYTLQLLYMARGYSKNLGEQALPNWLIE